MLTLQFIPYSQISSLGPEERIKKILSLVKQEKIILLEGRLKQQEEADLIQKTMEDIDSKFTGIELSVIEPDEKDTSVYNRARKFLAKVLLGDRQGFTVVGPANIIKEIKKDPEKIQLLMKETKTGSKKKK
ncbi:MAG: DUF2073 domain-containing protein [Candidatus Woesearchaeota archaeon]|nr:DUF2073 domain-containing protein [Candidatus Woesearchaeota archaeon]